MSTVIDNSNLRLDWTIDAQKFLSCIARFQQRGQNFGINYTIEVLRGLKNQDVIQHGHCELSTYGIGRERSVEDWRLLAQWLLFQSLVQEDRQRGNKRVLQLNDASLAVMRGQRPVLCPKGWIARQSKSPEYAHDILTLHLHGLSALEIAQIRNSQEPTILTRLSELILRGEEIDIDREVTQEGQTEIMQAFETLGTESLRNIYDHVDRKYNYGQIRLVLAKLQFVQ
ncbi:ATP-dependent DNA helicase RecQ [Leptolyngbya sp. NIES-3755]|nr:ATP-dependent DNA helicase RecQ [Leptolyngbya sp. NIES-3755]